MKDQSVAAGGEISRAPRRTRRRAGRRHHAWCPRGATSDGRGMGGKSATPTGSAASRRPCAASETIPVFGPPLRTGAPHPGARFGNGEERRVHRKDRCFAGAGDVVLQRRIRRVERNLPLAAPARNESSAADAVSSLRMESAMDGGICVSIRGRQASFRSRQRTILQRNPLDEPARRTSGGQFFFAFTKKFDKLRRIFGSPRSQPWRFNIRNAAERRIESPNPFRKPRSDVTLSFA